MTGILVVPAYGSGRGGGHLVRSAALVRELRSLGRDAWLFIPSEDLQERKDELAPLMPDISPDCIIDREEELRCRTWDQIILDRFRTSRQECDRWASLGPLIGIDEGGPARDSFDFLLDILPGLPNRSPANRSLPALIPLPKHRREEPFAFPSLPGPVNILVSFGSEDPEGLMFPVCKALSERAGNVLITAVCGSLSGGGKTPPWLRPYGPPPPPSAGALPPQRPRRGVSDPPDPPLTNGNSTEPADPRVRIVEAFPGLKEKLADYDLAITHFGLTAFEALYAGTPALLVSPTSYHEKLARHAGFVSAGIRQRGVKRLCRYLYRPRQKEGDILNRQELAALAARSAVVAEKYGLAGEVSQSLGGLLAGFRPLLFPVCPICGTDRRQDHPVLARFSERTYRRCPRCGMVYMARLTPPPIEYSEDYFFEFYRRQYGKTYLEDFPNLKQAGKIRLRRIRRLLSVDKNPDKTGIPRLLDIGCAYGPFLVAAAEGGFSPLGIDPAEDAVRYVTDRLKIPAITGFFPDPSRRELRDGAFDALTLWYVIEHLEDSGAAIREIGRLLRPGGILAFSTPSISGISSRKSLKRFLEKSPGDHVTLWDPRRVKRALALYGFTVKKIVVTGHHPERFPFVGKYLGKKRGLMYRIVEGISRLFGLGDTFEAYAVKHEGG